LIRELWLDENAGDFRAAIPRDRTCSFDIVVARNDPLKTMTAARFVGFGSRIGEAQQFQRGKAGANELCQVYFRPGMSAQVTAAFQRPLDRTPAVNSPEKLRYALSSTSRIRAPSPVSIRSGNGRNKTVRVLPPGMCLWVSSKARCEFGYRLARVWPKRITREFIRSDHRIATMWI
jgi:hypothetical protein